MCTDKDGFVRFGEEENLKPGDRIMMKGGLLNRKARRRSTEHL